MVPSSVATLTLALLVALVTGAEPAGQVRTQHFDQDPGWEGHNNRAAREIARTIRQDFGYSDARHAVGGFITPAAEPAYYAKPIPPQTLDDRLTAAGSIACPTARFHILLAFFNSHTLNEWRTPNTVAIRLLGRGEVFYAFVEYATRDWRAGGDSPGGFATVAVPGSDRPQLRGFARGAVHRWSIVYDPAGHDGAGAVTVTIDDETSICNLGNGHRQAGATFDHFGLLPVLKSADDGGEVWLDDVTVNGVLEDFSRDPGWDGYRNRVSYETHEIRPHGDFGYSPTRFTGGDGPGEMGGSIYRGDCRYASTLASYGDRLGPLTLDRPFGAAGKLAMLRGVSDSTTLIGFYHSVDSMTVTDSQSSSLPRSFVGIAIEGPSSQGFFVYPAYHTIEGRASRGTDHGTLRIFPDGAPHTWSLAWVPAGAEAGHVDVSLDGAAFSIPLDPGVSGSATRLDRFGIVTTWIDGNGQRVYLDDLQYTVSPAP